MGKKREGVIGRRGVAAAIGVFVLLLSAGVVHAIPVFYTAPFNSGPIGGPTQTDFSVVTNVPKFNIPGATLNSVHIALNATANTPGAFVACIAPGVGGVCSGTITVDVDVTLSAPGPVQLAQVTPLNALYPYVVAPPAGLVLLPPPAAGAQAATDVYCVTNDDPFCTAIDAAKVALFAGPGVIPLTFSGQGTVMATGANGFALFGASSTASGSFTVFYDYFYPVPEPATLLLLGTGLVYIGGRLVRRRLGKR